MSDQKPNMMPIACALLITSVLCWLPQDRIPDNLLIAAFVLLALLLVAQQLRWETRQLPQPAVQPEPTPEAPALVMLIVGPYAKKWFSQSNYTDSARYSGKAAWLMINTPEELVSRLDYIKQHDASTLVAAFFPFLPDGHETVELINDQLVNWKKQFACIAPGLDIPCTLAVYAQLSTERRRNSASNASWSGALDFGQQQGETLHEALAQVKAQLLVKRSSASNFQRAALGDILLSWLEAQAISATLNQVFNHSPLRFCTLLLCDYGRGFTQHGAWSSWLEARYAMLPALGHKAIMPPLPTVKCIPVMKRAGPDASRVFAKQPALLWSLALISLLLASQIGMAGWQSLQQQKAWQQAITPLKAQDELSVVTLKHNLMTLQQLHAQWQHCATRISLLSWGLSPCHAISQALQKRISHLNAIRIVTTAETVPLFEPGKATIMAKAITTLEKMAQQIALAPGYRILVVGHSDNTGSDALNASLSLKRAKAVRSWLIKNRVDHARIQVRGVGATEPVSGNGTVTGRQSNRRVEILLLPVELPKEPK